MNDAESSEPDRKSRNDPGIGWTMREPGDFHDLVRRVREGDQGAAAELVRLFEDPILRVIRTEMRSRGDYDQIRRDFSAVDICQSVFASLFTRLKEDRFDFEKPQDLRNLLCAMAHYKISSKAKLCRVKLRAVLDDDMSPDPVDPGPGPEKSVDDKDFSAAVLKHFTLDELEVVIRRLDEQSWAAIAAALGGTPEARRKQLNRAFDRVRDDPELRDLSPN